MSAAIVQVFVLLLVAKRSWKYSCNAEGVMRIQYIYIYIYIYMCVCVCVCVCVCLDVVVDIYIDVDKKEYGWEADIKFEYKCVVSAYTH